MRHGSGVRRAWLRRLAPTSKMVGETSGTWPVCCSPCISSGRLMNRSRLRPGAAGCERADEGKLTGSAMQCLQQQVLCPRACAKKQAAGQAHPRLQCHRKPAKVSITDRGSLRTCPGATTLPPGGLTAGRRMAASPPGLTPRRPSTTPPEGRRSMTPGSGEVLRRLLPGSGAYPSCLAFFMAPGGGLTGPGRVEVEVPARAHCRMLPSGSVVTATG